MKKLYYTAMFDFYVGNVEEYISLRTTYLCNLYGSVKGHLLDTLNHDLLIAKLGEYEFKRDLLRNIKNIKII